MRIWRLGNRRSGADPRIGAAVFRGMVTLALGAGAGRLIGIASIPVLTRIYSTEDYGVLTVFVGLVAQLAPFMTLRYVVAIPLPRTDEVAMNLLALSVVLIAVTATLATILLWVFAPVLLAWTSADALIPWWWLIILGGVAIASYEVLTVWATRQRAYRIAARTLVIQSIAGESTKIGLGLLGLHPLGLIIGQITSQSGGVGTYLVQFSSAFRQLFGTVNRARVALVAGRFRDFPLFRLPSQLLLVFSMQAPVLFTAVLFDADIVGLLGLAIMALALPMDLIGQSMSQAYYAEISRMRNDPRQIRKVTFWIQKRLFLIALPIVIVVVVLGEPIFVFMFGADWSLAGRFASVMAVYLLPQLISVPLMQMLNVLEKQSSFLLLNLIRAGGMVLLFIWGGLAGPEPLAFVVAISAFLCLFFIFSSVYAMHLLRQVVKMHELGR